METSAQKRTREALAAQQADGAAAAVGSVSGRPLKPYTIDVNGREVLVDHRTFTILENHRRKEALAAAGLPTDDRLMLVGASVWTVLRREEPDLQLEKVLDSLTLGAVTDATAVDEEAAEVSGASNPS